MHKEAGHKEHRGGQGLPALPFTPVACGIHRPLVVYTGWSFVFPRNSFHRLPLQRRNGNLDGIAVFLSRSRCKRQHKNDMGHACTHTYIYGKSHCSKREMHTNEQNDIEFTAELPLMYIIVYQYTNTYTTSV